MLLLQTRHFGAPWVTVTPTSSRKTSSKISWFRPIKCSVSTTHLELEVKSNSKKPFPAEVSRSIMELARVGTLSTLTQEGWPLGIGVRFAVDPEEGTPFFSFNHNAIPTNNSIPSSLHVQFIQSGLRTPQCTLQGTLTKPQDPNAIKLDDFQEDGVWVTSLDYKNSQPDPLREFAEELVTEINTNNMEDITRFCNVYVDLDFLVSEAKMIWVDRLGFDMRLSSPHKGIFEVRIPFPREVTDEKGAKSTFNCMSQLAWEVERNFHPPDFEKVKQLKHIKS